MSDKNNKALVLGPPRNILKALKDKNDLEQSGQFIVGETLDSIVVDILRDPFGFLTRDMSIEAGHASKYTSSFRRNTFAPNSDGTRKRYSNAVKADSTHYGSNSMRKYYNYNPKASSIIDGIYVLFKIILHNIGKFERILQTTNLLPNYKNTILRTSTIQDELENTLNYHTDIPSSGMEYSAGSTQDCDSKDMENKHHRCIVSIKPFLL